MFDFLKKISGDPIRRFQGRVAEINALEPEFAKLSDLELKQKSLELRSQIEKTEKTLDEALPEAFALVREAAKRTLGQRPFDVQLVGGLVLHEGAVSEMMTGEGKTLAAVAPAYLNALEGKGVHVITVNEYLARRDAVWMGQIYRALGLTVSCLVPNAAYLYDPDWKIPPEGEQLIDKERDTTGSFLVQQEYLRPARRPEAYRADITYGTNHEFGFDYLRDNLAYSLGEQAQRGYHFAIIDEVDSILIDEARTPLIIAAPDAQSSEFYKTFARVVANLSPEADYVVDEKLRSASITDAGIEKVEKMIGIKNLYDAQNMRLVHYLEESLRAKALFRRDKDYVVKNGEILIVDEFTGRMLIGRRYNAGLHQAIEAKEGVLVKEESRTYAKISIQNYFRLYKKISGMTGTAQTSAEEFHKVYKLEVATIPTNRPMARTDMPDVIYRNQDMKLRAVVHEVKTLYEKGQPILLGTASIAKNELVSAYLTRAGIPHEVLNAKNNEREGAIIAQAGKLKAVTVATNVAGRGVDIILGGNPPDPKEAEKVRELGGLHIIGTERNEARRIDNQFRGRAGRQGDPGSSRFSLSLDDDLLRIFGGDRIKNLMERFDLPEDHPIEIGFVSRAVAQAQAKVEGANFDMRKHLLEYDDVLNKQRTAIYAKRQEMLGMMSKDDLQNLISEAANSHLVRLEEQFAANEDPDIDIAAERSRIFKESGIVNEGHPYPEEYSPERLERLIRERSLEIAGYEGAQVRLLNILDLLWMTHLEDLEALSESIGLRAYGQREPLVEYRREAHNLFKNFWGNFNAWIFANLFKLTATGGTQQAPRVQVSANPGNKVGRNDPCPCGAVNPETGHVYKYKKCGLINAQHHKR